eukprot:CAMPEP_0206158282 /NCGR_PEP_ID=MMETSP1474-20131121/4691_1 /ASSEMBLY_ACC=CAM_ASM_001110 /TAXON_ID=97495 /ORGANISM="Imantonia sp., Strain RCC918" /LENGTH=198 /DNA_ID=CAMNT_0053558259 /DNA_START=156 /DNA_END=749 /DNA_ORIENTATION=+
MTARLFPAGLLLLLLDKPIVHAQCSNTCFHAGDSVCDDGGLGSEFSACSLGTDCDDCGTRGRGRLEFYLAGAQNVPDKDAWLMGHSDPYVIVETVSGSECGRTTTKNDALHPTWDEWVSCGCVDSSGGVFKVYDDDSISLGLTDELLGTFDTNVGMSSAVLSATGTLSIATWTGTLTDNDGSGMSLVITRYWDTGACT